MVFVRFPPSRGLVYRCLALAARQRPVWRWKSSGTELPWRREVLRGLVKREVLRRLGTVMTQIVRHFAPGVFHHQIYVRLFIDVVEERECRGKHEHANRRYGAKQQNQFSLVLCWTDLCVGAQDRSRLSTHCRRFPERSPVSSSHNPGTTHFRGAVIFDLPRWMKSKVGF